jgi:hypothetical protein
MDDHGNFLRSTVFTPEDCRWYEVDDRSDVLLQRDLQTCRELTKEELFMLEPESKQVVCTAEEKTARMLYLLQRDLLGSPIAGMILEKKCVRECFYTDKDSFPAYNARLGGAPVTLGTKVLLWLALLTLLALMVAYILYFALLYPSQLQRAWLYSLYVFVGFDCVAVSTMEVVITHLWIPLTILADMVLVRDIVQSTLQRYQANTADMYAEESKASHVRNFNAGEEFTGRAVNTRMIRSAQNQLAEDDNVVPNISEFFFVSARLAAYYSELPESKLVQTYATMLPPGALFAESSWWRPLNQALQDSSVDIQSAGTAQTPQRGQLSELRQRGYRTIFSPHSVALVFGSLFRSYIFSSVQVQDLLLQLLLVVVFGVLAVISWRLYKVQWYLVVAPLLVLMLVFGLVRLCSAFTRCMMHLRRYFKARRARHDAAVAAAASAATTGTNSSHATTTTHSANISNQRPMSPSTALTPVMLPAVAKPATARSLEQQRQMLINTSALRHSRVAPAPPSPEPRGGAIQSSGSLDRMAFSAPRRIGKEDAVVEYDSKSDSSGSEDAASASDV